MVPRERYRHQRYRSLFYAVLVPGVAQHPTLRRPTVSSARGGRHPYGSPPRCLCGTEKAHRRRRKQPGRPPLAAAETARGCAASWRPAQSSAAAKAPAYCRCCGESPGLLSLLLLLPLLLLPLPLLLLPLPLLLLPPPAPPVAPAADAAVDSDGACVTGVLARSWRWAVWVARVRSPHALPPTAERSRLPRMGPAYCADRRIVSRTAAVRCCSSLRAS
eukprot:COSAG06_NODE_7487_length_2488_cov_726.691503_2_plen_218_part_00